MIPRLRLRDALVVLAGSGSVELRARALAELEPPTAGEASSERGSSREGTLGAEIVPGSPEPEVDRLRREAQVRAHQVTPRILPAASPLVELEESQQWDLVAGELELRRIGDQAVRRRGAAVLVGWTPEDRLPELSRRLAAVGTAVVGLRTPPGALAPTLITGSRMSRSFRPIVDTYGTVPYANVDPSLFAGLTYALMFGMMFGDVGHGLILCGLALYVRGSRRPAFAGLRSAWPIMLGAGIVATGFGFLYGEAFGPTGLVPALWLAPLSQPVALLAAGIVVGAVLLAVSYMIGMINRWQEGGPVRALYASSGIAGACLYFGGGAAAAGTVLGVGGLVAVGSTTAVLGLALLFVGFLASAGGGVGGATEALVELVDAVVRTASNAVSFARLAAFGLTHAAIGSVVWTATQGLWGGGGAGVAGAIVCFVVGNVVAFALEALVVAVQSLRLEYYELFSRIFVGEGRVFTPWHLSSRGEEGS